MVGRVRQRLSLRTSSTSDSASSKSGFSSRATRVLTQGSYVTMVFIQYGSILAIRNRRVSLLQSNPLWGPRKNLIILGGMTGTALIAVVNLYGPGLQNVFNTRPIPSMFWGPPFGFALGILIIDELRKLIVRTHPEVSYKCVYDNVISPHWTSQLLPRWLGNTLEHGNVWSAMAISLSARMIRHVILENFVRSATICKCIVTSGVHKTFPLENLHGVPVVRADFRSVP